MPRRKGTLTVDSTDVQGEGSSVTIRKIRAGEIRDLSTVKDEEGGEAYRVGEDMIKTHVISWNWADEEGNPLPQPGADDFEEAFDEITDDELEFLAECITGSEKRRKN